MERRVFPYAGADARDTYAIGDRAEFHSSPAIRIAGTRAPELAGASVDDMARFDLYSCFPSAVQMAVNELGLPGGDPDRPLTVTGGLSFFGGPGNNYVTHSIATMAEQLAGPTRQARIDHRQRWLPDEAQLRRLRDRAPGNTNSVGRTCSPRSIGSRPAPRLVDWSGIGTVETWTTPVSDRDGNPEKAFLAVRTPEDARVLAVITDPADAEATVRDDIAGAQVRVHDDGTATLR